MSLTLSAASHVILLLPGLLFYLGYVAGPDQSDRGIWFARVRSTEFGQEPISYKDVSLALEQGRILTILLLGVILSVPLHEAWISLTTGFGSSLEVDYQTVLLLAGGSITEQEDFSDHLTSIAHHAPTITGYFLSLYIVSYFLGFSGRWLVTRTGLDRHIGFLDRRDRWYYLFTGNNPDFPPCDFALVSIVLEQGPIPYVYRGIIHSYTANRNDLLTLVMTDTVRFKLGGGDEGLAMSGEFFLIDCHQIKSMDVDNFYLSDEAVPSN